MTKLNTFVDEIDKEIEIDDQDYELGIEVFGFDRLKEIIENKTKQCKVIDINKQVPPVGKNVLMLIDSGHLTVGHVTELGEIYLNVVGIADIDEDNLELCQVVGWVDGLVGFIV